MEVIQRSEQNGTSESPQLVDKMDSAIGEASTSIGMIMSELVRRSLRGGVGEIGASIHEFARDEVSVAVDDAMPKISMAVEELAESTSQRVTDRAVQRFGEELKGVETRTTEQTQAVAARLKEESAAALETVSRVAGESLDTAQSTARHLKDLLDRSKDSWKNVQLQLQMQNEARLELERQLLEARQRLERFPAEFIETRKLLAQSEQCLNQTRQELAETTAEVAQLGRTSSQNAHRFASLLAGLTERLDELERPKGIRALFSKITGRGRKQTNPEGDPSDTKFIEGPDDSETDR